MGPIIDIWAKYREAHLDGGEAEAIKQFGHPSPEREELEALRNLTDTTKIKTDKNQNNLYRKRNETGPGSSSKRIRNRKK